MCAHVRFSVAASRVSVCVHVLGKALQGFTQQTYSSLVQAHTCTRTHAHTQTDSCCLQDFISARHGWCPGPTQRAHSGVRTLTLRQPTSNPPIGPFPPALLCFIRGYRRRSSSFVPETCRPKINVDKDTGVKDKIMEWGGEELDSCGGREK